MNDERWAIARSHAHNLRQDGMGVSAAHRVHPRKSQARSFYSGRERVISYCGIDLDPSTVTDRRVFPPCLLCLRAAHALVDSSGK